MSHEASLRSIPLPPATTGSVPRAVPRDIGRTHWGILPPFVPGSTPEPPAGLERQSSDVRPEAAASREDYRRDAETAPTADPWSAPTRETPAADAPWVSPEPAASSAPWPAPEPAASSDPWALPDPDAPAGAPWSGPVAGGTPADDEPWAGADAGEPPVSDEPWAVADPGDSPLNAEPWASAPEPPAAPVQPGAEPAPPDQPVEDPAEGSWAEVMPGPDEPLDPWTMAPPADPPLGSTASGVSGFGAELTLGYTPVFAPRSWPEDEADEPIHPLDETSEVPATAWPEDGWGGEAPAPGGTPSGALPEAFFADAFFTPRVMEGDTMEDTADALEAERVMAAEVAGRLADLSRQIRERGFSALTDTPDPDQLARIIAGMVAGFVARSE
jgi:hypothetical protein